MKRKQLWIVMVAVACAVAVAVVAASCVRGASQSPQAADEAALRSVVTAYQVEQAPVVPAKFYGRQLTIGPCITLLKTHVRRLQRIATDDGIRPADIGWLYLSALKLQLRELDGALPVSWDGRIASWQVLEGGGDSYVVRAAVQMTLHWATWDAAKKRLVHPGSFTYPGFTTYDYRLQRIDGAWMVTSLVPSPNGGA